MLPLSAFPLIPIILLVIALIIGGTALVVFGVLQVPSLLRGSPKIKGPLVPPGQIVDVPVEEGKTQAEDDEESASVIPETVQRDSALWREGEDLLRYPRRLSALEQQLIQGFRDARDQIVHLEERLQPLLEKKGRDDILSRYRKDLGLLQRRSESMRRVLGLVWRTRAILEMRAHLAISARRRPRLESLPDADVEHDLLDEAMEAYEEAAHKVRKFVAEILDLSLIHISEPTRPY